MRPSPPTCRRSGRTARLGDEVVAPRCGPRRMPASSSERDAGARGRAARPCRAAAPPRRDRAPRRRATSRAGSRTRGRRAHRRSAGRARHRHRAEQLARTTSLGADAAQLRRRARAAAGARAPTGASALHVVGDDVVAAELAASARAARCSASAPRGLTPSSEVGMVRGSRRRGRRCTPRRLGGDVHARRRRRRRRRSSAALTSPARGPRR